MSAFWFGFVLFFLLKPEGMLERAETFEQELVCEQIPCSKPQVATQGQTRCELFPRCAEEYNVQCRELWGAQAPGKGGLAAQRALELGLDGQGHGRACGPSSEAPAPAVVCYLFTAQELFSGAPLVWERDFWIRQGNFLNSYQLGYKVRRVDVALINASLKFHREQEALGFLEDH